MTPPAHGPRTPYEPDERDPVRISRFAWRRVMQRLADLEDRLDKLDGDSDDAA
jgi:hypothetical protein